MRFNACAKSAAIITMKRTTVLYVLQEILMLFLMMHMYPGTGFIMASLRALDLTGALIWIMLFQHMRYMMTEVVYWQDWMVLNLRTSHQIFNLRMNT